MLKKLLTILLCVQLMLPATAFASNSLQTLGDKDDPPAITVQLSLKLGADKPDSMELEVSADISEAYGFEDDLKTTAVSMLDVVVAAHIQYYDIVDSDGLPLTSKEGVARLWELLAWSGSIQKLSQAFGIDQVTLYTLIDGVSYFNQRTSKYTQYGLDSPIDDGAQIALRVTQERDFDVYWEVGKLERFSEDGQPSWWSANADISENYGFSDPYNGKSVTVLDVLVSLVCEYWGLDTSIEIGADAISDEYLAEIPNALVITDGVITKAFGYNLESYVLLLNDQPTSLDTVITAYDWDQEIGDTVKFYAVPIIYPTNPILNLSWQVDDVLWDRLRLNVSSDLSEQNGFSDDYDGALPTLLDLLVAAHIEQFGQLDEKQWPNFLSFAKDGSPDVLFGIDSKRLLGLTATVNGREAKNLNGTVLEQLDDTMFAVAIAPRQTPAPVVHVSVNLRYSISFSRDTYELDLAADLSERYGFTDSYSGSAVTLLDALVATNTILYNPAMGYAPPGRMLHLKDGEITRFFTSPYMILDVSLVDNTPYTYMGLLNTRLADGAVVDFHAYDPLLQIGSGIIEGDWPIGEADDNSALVLLDYRMGYDFVLSQRHLPADLSERYGYVDAFAGEVPTALDALVQTIILYYNDSPEVVNRALRVDEDGTIGINLSGAGYRTKYIFLFINGQTVIAGDYSYDPVLNADAATPLPPGQLALHDNDLVQIWWPIVYRMPDGSSALGVEKEMVVWFEQRDANGQWVRPKNDSITADQWELMQYRIMGYPLVYAWADAATREQHTVAVQTQVTVLDEQGNSLGQPWGTGQDGIGNIWLADHSGNLTLVAGMSSNVTLDALLHVQVSPAPAANTDQGELQELVDRLTAWELRNTDFKNLDASSQQAVVGLIRSRPIVSQNVLDDYRLLDIDVYKLLDNLLPTAIAQDGKLDTNGPELNMQAMFALRALALGTDGIEETGLVAPLADIAWATAGGATSAAQALLALDSSMDQGVNGQGYQLPIDAHTGNSLRELLVSYLLDAQSDGAWGDATTTATVLTALAPYVKYSGDDSQVSASTSYKVFRAVASALTALGQMQDERADFGSTQANARVIVALGSLGVPLDEGVLVKGDNTVLDALMRSFVELPATAEQPAMGAFSAGGELEKNSAGFAPLALTVDKDASDWGLYALSSLFRSLDTQATHTHFFDFSDIEPLFHHPIAHPDDGDDGNETGGNGDGSGSGNGNGDGNENGTGNAQNGNPYLPSTSQVELYLNGNNSPFLETILSPSTPLTSNPTSITPGIFGSPGANPAATNSSPEIASPSGQVGEQASDITILAMIAGFGVVAIAAALAALIKLGILGTPHKP